MQAVVYKKKNKTRVSSGIIKAVVYEENTSLVTNIFRQFKYNTSAENDIRGPWSDGIDSLLNYFLGNIFQRIALATFWCYFLYCLIRI